MNILQKTHQKLGRIKCVVLDQWPYRSAMKAIPRIRGGFLPLLRKLPALTTVGNAARYEIHMLCGHRDADMGIWASWSILRFLDGMGRLIVHSDGTLTPDDECLWREIVGDLMVVDRGESDLITRRELAAHTRHLHPWRCSNWASAQLVDVHYFGDAPTLLIMDSDVLTFSSPQEVIAALTAGDTGFHWCRDLRDAYSATPEVLREVTGASIPRRLCAGFLVTPRLTTADFVHLDEQMQLIAMDPRVSIDHFWSCQTYYALLASRHANLRVFPREYANTDGRTGPTQVLRHYVGIPKVRFRYFTEGLPRILKQAGLAS